MTERAGPVTTMGESRPRYGSASCPGSWRRGRWCPASSRYTRSTGLPETTARKVLAALRDEGLIVTTPGWGSFVAERG